MKELLTTWVAIGIPLISFATMGTGVFFFVKTKGQMDALKEGSAAYKNLAEGYKQTIDQLEERLESTEAELEDLKRSVDNMQRAMEKAIDELIKGFERAGYGKGAPK